MEDIFAINELVLGDMVLQTVGNSTDDFSDDVNTTGVLATDGTQSIGNLETAGDIDWFAIDVVAGQSYIINSHTVSVCYG